RAGPGPSPVRRMGYARPPGLNRQKPTQTATLRRNPVEHGNIRVIESDGQSRHRATGLRYHDLRMRDHRVKFFRWWGRNCQGSTAIQLLREPSVFSAALVATQAGNRRPRDGLADVLSGRTLLLLAQLHLGISCDLKTYGGP